MLLQLPRLELTYVDGSGSSAVVRFTIKTLATVSEIEGAAIEMIAALSALTDAAFVSYEIVYTAVPEVGLIGAEGSDRLRVGVFIFDCVEADQVGLVEVPAIKDEMLVTDGPGAGVLIDVENADVLAFVDVLVVSGATNPFAVALDVLTTAYRQSRV